MLFRKPEVVEVPDAIKAMLDDVTLGGEPLHVFAQEVAEECLTVGRVGIMVDYPTVDDTKMLTVAQAQALGLRPTLQRYCAENIINWKMKRIGTTSVLSMVVLVEHSFVETDEFSGENKVQYRVLDLVEVIDGDLSQMRYRIRVFRINDRGVQEQIGEDLFPKRGGKFITSIPFFFLGTDSIAPEVDDPPLLDLVDVNLAHFRVSADYEHGCHFTGLPTPVISGYMPTVDGDKLYVGSSAAWTFPQPDARAYYLEFTGQGMSVLENNLQRKEQQMATLGARLLQQDQRINETATTAAIHHGGETSILSSIAQVLSQGLTKALTVFAEWASSSGDIKYQINRDFFPVPMDAATLTALVSSWQAGAISHQTLFENLKEGEVIASDTTFEDEEARIGAQPPTGKTGE